MAYAAPAPASAPAATAAPAPSKGRRILFGLLGLAMLIVGLVKIADGMGWTSSRSGRSSYSSSSTYTPNAISDSWLTGTWVPATSTTCATFVRFNADHTLSDNGGNGGSWSLTGYGTQTGTLTMSVTGIAPTSGSATRVGSDTVMLGNQTWRRGAC